MEVKKNRGYLVTFLKFFVTELLLQKREKSVYNDISERKGSVLL